jgi:hypothetical protein
MIKQVINVGSGLDTKDGDTVRAAFQKTNANFDNLYDAILTSNSSLNVYPLEINGELTVTIDLEDGKHWIFTGAIASDWTISLKNLNLNNNTVTTVYLYIPQGDAVYLPTSVIINSQPREIKRIEGQLPSLVDNGLDLLTLTIFRLNNEFTILAKLETFGNNL